MAAVRSRGNANTFPRGNIDSAYSKQASDRCVARRLLFSPVDTDSIHAEQSSLVPRQAPQPLPLLPAAGHILRPCAGIQLIRADGRWAGWKIVQGRSRVFGFIS